MAGGRDGIAHARRVIADDENRLMPEILKLAQFSEDNRVAEMNIGRRGVDTEFDAKRPAESQFFTELSFADNLGGAFF